MASFVYFCTFHILIQITIIYFEQSKLKKVLMVCLGLEPGAAWWKVQTNPLSYGGTPNSKYFYNPNAVWTNAFASNVLAFRSLKRGHFLFFITEA